MKPHPRNSQIQGDPFIPNRFIFGDAVEENGLEPYEYLIHTAEPGFVCRLVGMDQTAFAGREKDGFASAVLFDEEYNLTHYVTNSGFRLFDFNFWGEVPTAARLQKICDEAMQVYQRLHKAYAEREVAPKVRDFRLIPTKPLPPAERSRQIRQLQLLAKQALDDTLKRFELEASLRQTLSGGDQAVFTEAVLALQEDVPARDSLLAVGRDLLAFPDVMRPDGNMVSYELWAFPLMLSRAEAGMWWHFPRLEQLEPMLADILQLPPDTILWMSPTVFSSEMLAERNCQQLVHLAPTMDAGCDLALAEVKAARASFEAASRVKEPQLVLCWLPFIVERDKLPLAKVRELSQGLLEQAMPMVQQAVAAEMPYAEAELFLPLPWWEALATGVYAYNRKRFALNMAMLSVANNTNSLAAIAEYQPELQAFDVKIQDDDGKTLSSLSWLVTPDLHPDRRIAWLDMRDFFRQMGISIQELAPRLH